MLVDDTARVVAVSDAAGRLVLKPGRAGRFVREAWTDRYGGSALGWPTAGYGENDLGLACDADGCTLARNGLMLLLAYTPTALADDCGTADITVSVTAARDLCRRGRIIDTIDLRREDAVAVWLAKDGARTRTVVESTGDRVWMHGVHNDSAESPDDLEP